MLCDDADASLLDVGCANGYLTECLVAWCAERGIAVQPYGVDLSAALVAEARRRLPQWATRIWEGNAIDWVLPDGLRFDVVRTLFDCVPEHARRALVEHLMDAMVAAGGRLLVSSYVDNSDTRQRASTILRGLGFDVGGETRPAVRSDRVCAPSAWINKPT